MTTKTLRRRDALVDSIREGIKGVRRDVASLRGGTDVRVDKNGSPSVKRVKDDVLRDVDATLRECLKNLKALVDNQNEFEREVCARAVEIATTSGGLVEALRRE